MVRLDREDSRACLAKKAMKGPEDSQDCQDPLAYRCVHINSSITHIHAWFFFYHSLNTCQSDHVERKLVGMVVSLPSFKAPTTCERTTFHLSLHLHYIKWDHNLLMQPQFLITPCTAPWQIMHFPPSSRTFFIDSAKNPSPLLTFCIWHFATALMVQREAVGFPFSLHHYHAVKHIPAVFLGPNKRPAEVIGCICSILLLTAYVYVSFANSFHCKRKSEACGQSLLSKVLPLLLGWTQCLCVISKLQFLTNR